MLTLLLVCSFSPKVQKYLLGSPYFIAQESLFRSNKKPDKFCRVFVAEEEGFVLVFCKATLVSSFYALQKPSGSR